MYKICVLMTCYNPNEFIIEQINSILNQKNVEVEIVLRDDGSNNKEYLEYFKDNSKITVIEGENIGVARNIMFLINYAKKYKQNYNFFAYSDQDDYWMDTKLYNGIKALEKMNNDKPLLYYSNLIVADEQLQPLYHLFKKNVVNNSIGQSLSQVFCYACTTVFNKQMINELSTYDIKTMGFDSLIYYVAILLGEIYYDENSYILYRQHSNNLSGKHDKGVSYLLRKIKNISKFERVFENNALYLINNMKDKLNSDQVKTIETVAFYRNNIYSRLKLIFSKNIRAGYYPKDFFVLFRRIIGKY